jgi:hypothetical protein
VLANNSLYFLPVRHVPAALLDLHSLLRPGGVLCTCNPCSAPSRLAYLYMLTTLPPVHIFTTPRSEVSALPAYGWCLTVAPASRYERGDG